MRTDDVASRATPRADHDPDPSGPVRSGEPVERRRSWLPLLLPVLVVSLLLLAGVTVTLPYYTVGPGEVVAVTGRIRVPDERGFPPRGELLLTSVLLRSATALEALSGWIDDDVDVVPAPQVLGAPATPETRQEFSRQGRQSMGRSQEVAVVVALRRLGIAVPTKGAGALVTEVAPGSAAEGRLAPGELITGVGGRPVGAAEELVEVVQAHRPGDVLVLEVVGTDDTIRTEDIVPTQRPGTEGPSLGVLVRTEDERFDLPFPVDIDAGEVGGSSGGLALSLGVLDWLTPGELTGGHRVAATGTIALDGRVGEVGGTGQKAAAARAAGAEYFLVPPGGVPDAVAHAGAKLRVLEVTTLEEAIAALRSIGGEVPPPAPE